MPLNIDPTNLSAMLIGDPVDGAPIVPTEVNGVPVAATLELQSTIRAFLLPRMTNTEMNALAPVVDGMIIYNITNAAVYFRQAGAWIPEGSGGGAGTVTSLTQGTNIILSPSPITTSGSVSLNPVLTGLTSVTVGTTVINNVGGITNSSSSFSITATGLVSDLSLTASTNILLSVGVPAGTGNVSILKGARLNFYNDATSQFIGLRAASGLVSSLTYVLPATAPSQNNQVLASTTGGTMSWQSLGTGSVTSITAGSNLTGGVITSTGTIGLATTISGLTSVSSATGVFGNITTTGNNITSSATMTLTSSGNLSLSGTNALVNSNLQLRTGNSLSLFNAANSFATSIAPANVTSSFTYTLPLTSPASNGQILSSTTGGAMSWITAAGTVTSITATGPNLTGGVITSIGNIGLSTTLTGLTSTVVGNITTSGSAISSSTGNLSITANGTLGNGNLLLNSNVNIILTPQTFANVDLQNNCSLRLFDSTNTNFVGFKTVGNLSVSLDYVLPSAIPTVNGQVLTSTTAGVMSWATVGAGTVTSISATGPNLTGGVITSTGSIGLSATLTGITSAVIGGTTYSSSGIAATGAYSIGTSASVIQLAPTTTVDVVSDLQLIFNASTKAIRFFDQTNTNSVTLKSPGTLVQTTNYVFPTDYPAVSGYHLASTTGGVMSWSADTGAPGTSKYLIQTADGSLPNAQVMGSLTTGLVKNTTTTGVQSIAVAGTDYYAPDATYALRIANVGGTPNANLFLANTMNAPTTPAGGGVFYVQAGALLFMGSNGTVTTIAPA